MVFETIAFASLATPAERTLYGPALGSDKGVQKGNVLTTSHRDVALRCQGPVDVETLQRIGGDTMWVATSSMMSGYLRSQAIRNR